MAVAEILTILLFFIGLMLLLYLKYKMLHLIIIVYLFALIIGALSFTIGYIPFTPYIQIFYVVFITVIFVYSAIDYNNYKNKK